MLTVPVSILGSSTDIYFDGAEYWKICSCACMFNFVSVSPRNVEFENMVRFVVFASRRRHVASMKMNFGVEEHTVGSL